MVIASCYTKRHSGTWVGQLGVEYTIYTKQPISLISQSEVDRKDEKGGIGLPDGGGIQSAAAMIRGAG